jgi:hypothetical protein
MMPYRVISFLFGPLFYPNGVKKLLLTPSNPIERLTALLPYPRKHQIRYHGFFGPNSHVRQELIANRETVGFKSKDNKIDHPDFPKLMARVFDIDVLECPRCKSRIAGSFLPTEPKRPFWKF